MPNSIDTTLAAADPAPQLLLSLPPEPSCAEHEQNRVEGYKLAMRQRASRSRIRLSRCNGGDIYLALGEQLLRGLGIWERLQEGKEVRITLQFDDETGEFGVHECGSGKRLRLSRTGRQGSLVFAPTSADVPDLLIGTGKTRTVHPRLQRVQLSPDDESVAMLTWSCVDSTVPTVEHPPIGAVEPGADETTNSAQCYRGGV